MNRQKPGAGIRNPVLKKRTVLFFCILYSVFCILYSIASAAEEPPTNITADSIEHDKKSSTYFAKGAVKVVQDGTKIDADAMRYDEKTGNAFAEGNVRYEDDDIILKAKTADYNLEKKTGTFYDAQISSKKNAFNVSGSVIEKKDKNEYSLTDATVTTCTSTPPEWCFKGKTMDIIVGDRVKGRNVTFNVKKLPILYTPYLWAPVITERKTGFLTPIFGYSTEKGLSYRQPFFWAISEDKDATFIFDWYRFRGVGKGLEYRHIGPSNISGTNWLYNISDPKLDRNFIELRSANAKRDKDFSAYANLNILSGRNFYREYSRNNYERIQRFLESTAEISYFTDTSRLYLMSQYLMDLKDGEHTSDTLHRLPELGYIINPRRVGPIVFSLNSSATDFWRDRGVFGQRVDLYPRLSHYFGDKIILSQNLGLRNTTYYLHRNEKKEFKDTLNRSIFDYNITASSRILKKYASFSHAVEPSVGYIYIPRLKKEMNNTPMFDATELYSKTSLIWLSAINRFFDNYGEFLTLSVSESYNSYGSNRPFSPISIAVSITRPIRLRGDTSYNTYKGKLETVNSDIEFSLKNMAFSVGERYNRTNRTMFFDVGLNYIYSKNLSAESKVWYDAKGGGVRDLTLRTKFQQQCWGVAVAFTMRPGDEATKTKNDYTVFITFDLLGLGSMKI